MNTAIKSTPRVAGFVQGIVLLLPSTLSAMGIVVLMPVLPQMVAHFAAVPHYMYLLEGGVLTMPALCVMLFSPAAGWLADRVGRRRILLMAILLYAPCGIAPIFLDGLYGIIATRIGVGVCESVIMTVSTTLISDCFADPAREKWLAGQATFATLSSFPLIMAGGLLGAAWGWRGPFAIYLFSIVLFVCIWRFTWEPDPQAHPQNPGPRQTTLFPWRRMVGICGVTLFASLLFFTIQTQSSLAFNAMGVQNPAKIADYSMVAALGVPLGAILFRVLSRLHVGLLLVIAFALIAGGFLMMGQTLAPRPFVFWAALNELGCGLILATLITWATRGLAYDIRGRGTGMWTGTFHAGQFLSGVIVTFLAARLGGVLPAFSVLGAVSFVAAACALVGFAVDRRAAPAVHAL